MKNDNASNSAFPRHLSGGILPPENAALNEAHVTYQNPTWKGLTKREYFAAIALQGILSNPNTQVEGVDINTFANAAVTTGNALIKALNEHQNNQ